MQQDAAPPLSYYLFSEMLFIHAVPCVEHTYITKKN